MATGDGAGCPAGREEGEGVPSVASVRGGVPLRSGDANAGGGDAFQTRWNPEGPRSRP